MINRRSLTVIELILSVCIISVLIGSFAGNANLYLRVGRETALKNELINLRTSLEFYRIVNGNFPEELEGLKNNKLTMIKTNDKVLNKSFIEGYRSDKQGFLIDPFLNRYGYNASKGTVYSQTKDYERW